MNAALDLETIDELAGAEQPTAMDLRMVFLARAAAKFYLVENGLEDLDQAFADLHHALHAIAPCQCQRSMLDAWEQLDRDAKAAPVSRPARRRAAAASTYEAVLYTLRTRESAALGERHCRQRLAELSDDQMRELVAALKRLKPQYPSISEELMLELGKRIR